MSDVKTLKNILLVKNVKESIRDNENIIFKIIPALECEKGFDQKKWLASYNKLFTIQFCDASAYEPSHAKKIIKNLTEIQKKLENKGCVIKWY